MNFNDVAIFFVKGADYRIHFWYMSKNYAINIMKNSNLNEKSGSLLVFPSYIKISQTTYYERNVDVILNRAKYYYKNDQERLRDNARDKYRNLSEEETNKKREYGRNRYRNMPEEKKQKTKRISKKILRS